jgi:hypothetical protein
MPDLSRMVGEPNAPAETTTRRVALATYVFRSADELSVRSLVYSTPTARPFLDSVLSVGETHNEEIEWAYSTSTLMTTFSESIHKFACPS